ncbi:MAG: hypothetical protein ACLR2E_16595 [Lachnospiraceae bacterium]
MTIKLYTKRPLFYTCWFRRGIVYLYCIRAAGYCTGISFLEWKGGPKKTFIGIANYKQLFQDGVFWQAFGHNIYLVIACIIGQIGIVSSFWF